MNNTIVVGWREWVGLPELGIPHIKAKIDTGARTSALHTRSIRPFRENGILKVEFMVNPSQDNTRMVQSGVATVVDTRWVTDSGGHREQRFVIHTVVKLGEHTWPIEMTLTNRDTMRFRMLLGRTAMRHVVVHPTASFLLGRIRKADIQ